MRVMSNMAWFVARTEAQAKAAAKTGCTVGRYNTGVWCCHPPVGMWVSLPWPVEIAGTGTAKEGVLADPPAALAHRVRLVDAGSRTRWACWELADRT